MSGVKAVEKTLRVLINGLPYEAVPMKAGEYNMVYRIDHFGEPARAVVLKIPKMLLKRRLDCSPREMAMSDSDRAVRVLNEIREDSNSAVVEVQFMGDFASPLKGWITNYLEARRPSNAEFLYGMIQVYEAGSGRVVMDPYAPGNFLVQEEGPVRKISLVDVDFALRPDSPTFNFFSEKPVSAFESQTETIYENLAFLHSAEDLLNPVGRNPYGFFTTILLLQYFSKHVLVEQILPKNQVIEGAVKIALLSSCHHREDTDPVLSIRNVQLFASLIPHAHQQRILNETVESLFAAPCKKDKKWQLLFRLSFGFGKLIHPRHLETFKAQLENSAQFAEAFTLLQGTLLNYSDWTKVLPSEEMLGQWAFFEAEKDSMLFCLRYHFFIRLWLRMQAKMSNLVRIDLFLPLLAELCKGLPSEVKPNQLKIFEVLEIHAFFSPSLMNFFKEYQEDSLLLFFPCFDFLPWMPTRLRETWIQHNAFTVFQDIWINTGGFSDKHIQVLRWSSESLRRNLEWCSGVRPAGSADLSSDAVSAYREYLFYFFPKDREKNESLLASLIRECLEEGLEQILSVLGFLDRGSAALSDSSPEDELAAQLADVEIIEAEIFGDSTAGSLNNILLNLEAQAFEACTKDYLQAVFASLESLVKTRHQPETLIRLLARTQLLFETAFPSRAVECAVFRQATVMSEEAAKKEETFESSF